MKVITNSNSWVDFENKLNSLSEKAKGNAFEELTRLYFLTDPVYVNQLDKVWHHSEVPQKIKDELKLPIREIGIDLICKTKKGDYWAVQCKFHQDTNKNVTLNELKTFFGMTERASTYKKLSHRLIVSSAQAASRNIITNHPDKLGYLLFDKWNKLGKEQFDSFRKILKGEKVKRVPYKPYRHQKKAVANCVKYFKSKKNTRGKVIHPCGSGKSLTGYWFAEALKAKTIIIAVPSIALVRQTLSTWTREALANNINMDWIAVCSDEEVSYTDDPSMRKEDLDIQVTTNLKEISNFLKTSKSKLRVLITTYQSGKIVCDSAKKCKFIFDLGIFDEAHKTVGHKDKLFSHLLYDENIKISLRIFMTATERQFKGKSENIISMSDKDLYGNIFDELSFKKALEQKPPILSDYRIVTTIISQSDIDTLIRENKTLKPNGKEWENENDASTFASLIILRKLIKEKNIKHIVSFHRSIIRAKEFKKLNLDTNKNNKSNEKLEVFHISGKDGVGTREAIIDRFVNAKKSLITNARCLTEGVDVPAIDAVLFADPKKSKIDIVQAAGRALRVFAKKKYGYIIVPVVINENDDDASNNAFNQIINVVSALGMHDERIIEQFNTISKGNGNEKIISINGETDSIKIKYDDLIQNIQTRIWDRLSFGWVIGFNNLKDYVEKNGSAFVPLSHITDDGFNLGSWVSHRRREYKREELDKKRIELLEAFPDWCWDANDFKNQNAIIKLKKYVKDYGDCNVSARYKDEDGFSLGTWVRRQKSNYHRKKLDFDLIRVLEAIPGWSWDDFFNTKFINNFEKIKHYCEKNGNSIIPIDYKDDNGYSLGGWVANIRKKYKKDELDTEQIKKLESLKAWKWQTVFDDAWETGFNKLKKYIKDNGNANIKTKYFDDDGYALGRWVLHYKKLYKLNKLKRQNIKELESLKGWFWETEYEKIFKEGYLKLKNYVRKNKTAYVPTLFKDNDGFGLGQWVSSQRKLYKKNKLEKEKIKLLELFDDWVWDVSEERFNRGFFSLKEYVKLNGHANVHSKHIDKRGFNLGKWISHRRDAYKKNILSHDRIKKLESLPGWVWDKSKKRTRS